METEKQLRNDSSPKNGVHSSSAGFVDPQTSGFEPIQRLSSGSWRDFFGASGYMSRILGERTINPVAYSRFYCTKEDLSLLRLLSQSLRDGSNSVLSSKAQGL